MAHTSPAGNEVQPPSQPLAPVVPEGERVDAAAPQREVTADLYRVIAVLVVVIGHWLVSAVTYRDGRFGNDYPLEVLPWTQWLTLLFQVVPVFFLVGGYASAASWTRWCGTDGPGVAEWVRSRVAAILGPTTAYVVAVLAVIAALAGGGVARSPLVFGGWAVAMHLWFVPVYLVVVALTPVAVAAHRRWALRVPAVLAVAVAGVDAIARLTDVHTISLLNYLLVWAAVYQLGICWHAGLLKRHRPVVLAAVAVVLVVILLVVGGYPISMVGAPGAAAQNNFPPNLALLLFGCAQAGVLVAAAPAVSRLLRRRRCRTALAAVNAKVMALYLWQMIPVVVVALVAYPTGLLPQPEAGTAAWFFLRIGWLAILAVVMAVVLAASWLARAVTDRALPAVDVGLPKWATRPLLVIGIGAATVALAHFAVAGFAADGRFPTESAALYGAGVALVSLSQSTARVSSRVRPR